MKPHFQAGWRQVLEEKSGLGVPGLCSRPALNPELLPGPFIPVCTVEPHRLSPGPQLLPPNPPRLPISGQSSKDTETPPNPPLQWQSRSVSHDRGSDGALGDTAHSMVCEEEAQGTGTGAPCKRTGPRWCPTRHRGPSLTSDFSLPVPV